MVRPPAVPDRGLRTAPRCDLLAARLPTLSAALARERDFRREQLARLAGHEQPGRTSTPQAGHAAARDPSVREVHALVAAGARYALDEIERAQARVVTGEYGRCRACGVGIALVVLEAIPQTTLCLSCQRRCDGADGRVPRTHPLPEAVS